MYSFPQSPHLDSVLKRHFCRNSIDILKSVYELSILNCGSMENGLHGRNFPTCNAKPARIAIILINDATVRCAEVIAAGFLACANEDQLQKIDFASLSFISDYALSILELSRKAPDTLLNRRNSLAILQASRLACALWLDRARHVHIAENLCQISKERFLQQTALYILLSKVYSPKISVMLKAWEERFIKKQLKHTERKTLVSAQSNSARARHELER